MILATSTLNNYHNYSIVTTVYCANKWPNLVVAATFSYLRIHSPFSSVVPKPIDTLLFGSEVYGSEFAYASTNHSL